MFHATAVSGRLALAFAGTLALASCGGGGGGSNGPGGGTPSALEDCMSLPLGVANVYRNAVRPRHQWRQATFRGQAVIARDEYASASAAHPERAWYYRADAAARTVATVGHEWFDGAGAVVLQVSYDGLALSTALAAGESQTVNYVATVHVPAGTPAQNQRMTFAYDGLETVTLPGGRLQTCKTRSVVSSVSGAGVVTELSREQAHSAKGAGQVKSYFTPTASQFSDARQTYLSELASSTAALTFGAGTAGSTPSLGACAQIPLGRTLTYTASSPLEADSALRAAAGGTFASQPSTAVSRRRVSDEALTSVHHFDPTRGFLDWLGTESVGATPVTTVYSGRPDLSGTAVGQTVAYTTTATRLESGDTVMSNDSFTFVGHERVTTPLGTFDTCKVRFNVGTEGISETYFLAPDRHWVRLETASPSGVTTTRELVTIAP